MENKNYFLTLLNTFLKVTFKIVGIIMILLSKTAEQISNHYNSDFHENNIIIHIHKNSNIFNTFKQNNNFFCDTFLLGITSFLVYITDK